MDSNVTCLYFQAIDLFTPSKDYLSSTVGKTCSKHSHFTCLHVQVSDSEDRVKSTCTK